MSGNIQDRDLTYAPNGQTFSVPRENRRVEGVRSRPAERISFAWFHRSKGPHCRQHPRKPLIFRPRPNLHTQTPHRHWICLLSVECPSIQMLKVRFVKTVSRFSPSGEKETAVPAPAQFGLRSVSAKTSLRFAGANSHTRTVSSSLPVMNLRPSGENAPSVTGF